MKMNLFFNRKSWDQFNSSLAHRHLYDSLFGYMPITGVSGAVTMLRCKCGHAQWFFQ